jgi:hypothetical protein
MIPSLPAQATVNAAPGSTSVCLRSRYAEDRLDVPTSSPSSMTARPWIERQASAGLIPGGELATRRLGFGYPLSGSGYSGWPVWTGPIR